MPVEIPDPIAFDQDRVHASYDRASVERFWRILSSVDTVFNQFRARFIGKSSPVHFFWGSFDLAVTRFSGRRAPERSGADAMTREAYSHEVSSVGFWPGSGKHPGCGVLLLRGPRAAGTQRQTVSVRMLPFMTGSSANSCLCTTTYVRRVPHGIITRIL